MHSRKLWDFFQVGSTVLWGQVYWIYPEKPSFHFIKKVFNIPILKKYNKYYKVFKTNKQIFKFFFRDLLFFKECRERQNIQLRSGLNTKYQPYTETYKYIWICDSQVLVKPSNYRITRHTNNDQSFSNIQKLIRKEQDKLDQLENFPTARTHFIGYPHLSWYQYY